jgi:UDP-GlcNAc:undecaprenyl-phosphate GlcNAc-1-phosphate transferase
MMIGLFVGVLAVWSSVKESTILASAPVAILAIPLFDSTAAVLRRWLTGRSIYATDRAHLHHLLQERFGSVRMLFIVAGLCITTTTLSVLSVVLNQPWLAALGVLIVLALLVLTRSFGHAEARLLMGRAFHFAQSFATPPAKCETQEHQRRVPLQGVGKWDTVWEPLVDFARTRDLAKVKIDLHLAWLQEGYHANWQSVRLPEKALQLNVQVPLFTHRASDASHTQIGRLEIVASGTDPDVYTRMGELSDLLADLGTEIDRIVAKLEGSKQRLSERPQLRQSVIPDADPPTSDAALSSSP